MAGGFTWRIGWHFEVGSPKQVQFGGKETLTLGPQSQVPTLGLAPYLESWWAPICPTSQVTTRNHFNVAGGSLHLAHWQEL